MTPIADMIAQMLAGGVAPEMIVLAVKTIEQSTRIHPNPVDETAEKRRAWDRQRKRETRDAKIYEGGWLHMVGAVLERDGHKCVYCGATDNLTADHVTPISRGGAHADENLVACCVPCNSKKSDKLLSEWSAFSEIPPDKVHPNCRSALILPSSVVVPEEQKKEKKVRGHRKQLSEIPPDWKPPERAHALARDLGLDVGQIEPRFRDYLASSGRRYADYDAGFCNFVRNTPKFNGVANGHGPRNGRTDTAAGPSPSGADAILAGMGRLASRVGRQSVPAGPENGEVPPSFDLAGGAPTERDAEGDAAAARRRAERELLEDARSGRWG